MKLKKEGRDVVAMPYYLVSKTDNEELANMVFDHIPMSLEIVHKDITTKHVVDVPIMKLKAFEGGRQAVRFPEGRGGQKLRKGQPRQVLQAKRKPANRLTKSALYD